MSYIDQVQLYTDGGSKGNPGAGSIGIVLCTSDNKLLHEFSVCIGECTNNVAEYSAIIKGLELAAGYTRRDVTCFSDSELVVKQINGDYRIKKSHLLRLFLEVRHRVDLFRSVTFQHVSRKNQRIQRADVLLSEAFNGKCTDRAA